MPTVQKVYGYDQGEAIAGMRYSGDGLFRHKVADGDVEFGLAVKRGTDPDVQASVGAGADFLGISMRSVAPEAAYSDQTIKIEDTESFEVMMDGLGYASPTNAVTAGDKIIAVDATGKLKGGASISAGETQLDGEWETSCDANEVALLNLLSKNVVSYITATAVETAKSFTHGVAITPFSPLTPVKNGYRPYHYYVSSGSLDAGLSLDALTGIVSGTPTSAAAAHNVTFAVKDAHNHVCATGSTVSITVA